VLEHSGLFHQLGDNSFALTPLHVVVTSHSVADMPKKSSKSKSKRTTLKQKYKVIKKVKEHGRKLRKEARKSGKKQKAPADPGLPKQWPFKQELIAELDEKRRLILEAEAAKKAERKAARVRIGPQPAQRMSPQTTHRGRA
jgi:L-cysteine desulfidase